VRKRIALLLGICLTFVMAYGVLGSGATFTATAAATQTLTVGNMTLQLSSSTVGSYFDGSTLVCPSFTVVTASGPGTTGQPGPQCNLKIESTGSIVPAEVDVKMSAATNGTHLSRYGLFPTGFPTTAGHTEGAFFFLATGSQQIGHFFGFELPGTINLPLDWGESVGALALDNADMGTTVVVSYSIEAFQ